MGKCLPSPKMFTQKVKMLRKFLRIVDATNEWSGKGVSFIILVLIALVVAGVVARYVFNAPFLWGPETSTFIFGIYMILGAGYVLAIGGHVNVDIIYRRLGVRARAIVDLCMSPLFFIFVSVLLWQGVEMSRASFGMWEHAATAWCPPVYPFKVFVPIGSFLLLMQGVAKFLRDCNSIKAVKQEEA